MRRILPEFRSVSGLLVAGGRATRLGGAEKALLDAGGRPIAARALDALEPLVAEVLVASPRPEAWRAFDVRVVPDEMPEAGPLGGLVAGLRAARTPWLLACAGDMPLLSRALLRLLCVRALATGRPVIPRLGGRPEPLHAVYRTAHLARALEALRGGRGKLTGWLDEGEVEWVDVERLRGLPGAELSFTNVNSPADLAEISRRISEVDTRRPRRET